MIDRETFRYQTVIYAKLALAYLVLPVAVYLLVRSIVKYGNALWYGGPRLREPFRKRYGFPVACTCPCFHVPPSCHYCRMGWHQNLDWMERY